MRDHLGNNRIVTDASGANVIQSNEYYPFGMLMSNSTHADRQPYKYSNKELDTSFDLNWYDFSACYQDGIKFTSIDPMAEKYYSWSPYHYAANNPLKYIDPDGRDPRNPQHWGRFFVDVFKATRASVSIGFQAAFKNELSGINYGVNLNVASIDLIGVDNLEIFHPGSNFEKSEIKTEVGIDVGSVGVNYSETLKNIESGDNTKTIKETTTKSNISFFEFENKTTNDVVENRDGSLSLGKSSTENKVKIKDAGSKGALILGVEFNLDMEKVEKSMQNLFLK